MVNQRSLSELILTLPVEGWKLKKSVIDMEKICGILDTPWNIPVTLAFLIPSEKGPETKLLKMVPGQKKFFLEY
jgi:hypothetical protein